MKKSDKREDILQAALEIIAERGFHESPMSFIAEKARVGSGTIYIYFKSKDELIREVHLMLERKILSAVQEYYPEGRNIKERLLHIGKTVILYMINNPVHFRFIEQYFNSPYGESLQRERIFGKSEEFDIFRKVIEEGIREKVLKDLPVFMHFALGFGPTLVMVRDHIFGLINFNEEQINQSLEAYWGGVKR